MTRRRRMYQAGAAAWAVSIALMGCSTSSSTSNNPTMARPNASTPAATVATDANLNPVAMRLHDLAGALLRYFAAHRELPGALADLQTGGFVTDGQGLMDPASGEPFAYRPQGGQVAGFPGELVVRQPITDPRGVVWGVLLSDAKGDGRWVARVVCVPVASIPRGMR